MCLVSSSSLSLLSDSDIRLISEKLSNARFGDLIEFFSDSMNKRLHRKDNKFYPQVSFKPPLHSVKLSTEQRAEHISCDLALPRALIIQILTTLTAYFAHVHPLFPFLLRSEFDQQVLNHDMEETPGLDTSFFALHNTVLAIGSQLNGYGSFEPGEGMSWQLFQSSLSCLGEITCSKPSLLSIQVRVKSDDSELQIN